MPIMVLMSDGDPTVTVTANNIINQYIKRFRNNINPLNAIKFFISTLIKANY